MMFNTVIQAQSGLMRSGSRSDNMTLKNGVKQEKGDLKNEDLSSSNVESREDLINVPQSATTQPPAKRAKYGQLSLSLDSLFKTKHARINVVIKYNNLNASFNLLLFVI